MTTPMTASASIVERLANPSVSVPDDWPAEEKLKALIHGLSDLCKQASRIITEKNAEIERLNEEADKYCAWWREQRNRAIAAESSRDAAVEACGEIVDVTLTYAECRDAKTYRDMNRIHVLADAIRSRAQTAREDGAGK